MANLQVEELEPILSREMGVKVVELKRLPFGASSPTDQTLLA